MRHRIVMVEQASAVPRVGFVGTFAARLEARVRAHLGVPCEVIVAGEGPIGSEIADVDVLVSMTLTREMATGRRLRLVQVPGAGLDRIERAALPPHAWLANAYGHEVGIAEYVIGAMLAWTRDFGRVDAGLRRGVWESQWAVGAPTPPPWPELAGKTLGILGYGRIGRALARRARSFDMAIWAIRRDPKSSETDDLAFLGGPNDLEKVLRQADYLAVTLALSEATRGLIGSQELRTMKPTAALINVARAEIIDEGALYEALKQHTIAGAVLDVWYRYPSAPGPTLPSHRPFHELPNVLMTPHVSGWTEGMLEARAILIAENIRRSMRGQPPLNLVSPRH